MGVRIENNLFYIESKGISLIIENRNGFLLLKHLGKTIKNFKGANSVYERDHAFSGNPTATNRTFSLDTQRQIFGQHGLGDFRRPTLQVQHDATEVTDFRFIEAKILKGQNGPQGLPSPHSMDGTETLALILEDSKAQLSLTLYYTAFDNNSTIASYSKLENKSNQEVVIHKNFSFMADFPAATYEIVTLQGAYAREKTVRRQQVEQGIFSISSNRGASGHAQTPAILLCNQGVIEDAGNVFAIQLMYSGNFEAFVQKNQLNEVRVAIGINPENFSWKLNPKENFETPVALVTYSDQGLTGISHESQDFVLKHIMPSEFSKKERPILINNWEATYFDFQREKLLELADEAKKVGIELFVLDDGWFGNRFDDNRALGDWVVNEKKLGGSLESLISAIHERGLQFGLWLEPEMISVDSDLYRKHPDWAIQVPEYEHTYSRNQLVLNLANPQVVEYLKNVLDELLSYHEIDYIKWDMNRNITNLGNGSNYLETKMQSHQYMLGLYELVSYLTEKHRHILFESCSGGGGRNDLAMMRYFPQVWASDNTDAIACLPIQYGSSYLYPTISMGAHVSAVPNHQMGRKTPLETRGHVAMMGNLGYELDLTSLSQEELDRIAAQVAHYKRIRSLVQLGQHYRLMNPSQGSNQAAVQFTYQDRTVVTYVRVLSTIEEIEPTLKLKGLEEDALYSLEGTNQAYSGAELMYAGLTVVLPQGDFLTKQYVFVKK